jgi:hypothetical protein
MRTPSSVIVKPSGVLNKPSGVLNKPSGVLLKPSGVIGSGGTPISAKQNFVGGEEGFRRFDGVRRNRDFRQDGFRNRSHRSSFIVVYVNGAPCWYPFYTAYPYYYDVPATGDAPLVQEGSVPAAPSYAEVGRQWGQDLRRDVTTWEQFVDYLRIYIIGALPVAQAEFRETFIASYGVNGAAAYDKAAEQAAPAASSSTSSSSQGPKIINMSSGNY